MILQKSGESRIEYLVRVLHDFMEETSAGEIPVEYDNGSWDGYCLADDLAMELEVNTDPTSQTGGYIVEKISKQDAYYRDPEDQRESDVHVGDIIFVYSILSKTEDYYSGYGKNERNGKDIVFHRLKLSKLEG